MTTKPLWLFLDINPQPWAVGPITTGRRGQKIFATMGRNRQLAAYQEGVREAIREQWGELPTLKGYVHLTVYLWRNRPQYTTPNDQKHRKHEADATNMLKALEDALQGVLIDNDRDNISVESHVMQQDENVVPKIVVRLEVVDPAEYRKGLMHLIPDDIKAKIVESEMSYNLDLQAPTWGDDSEDF